MRQPVEVRPVTTDNVLRPARTTPSALSAVMPVGVGLCVRVRVMVRALVWWREWLAAPFALWLITRLGYATLTILGVLLSPDAQAHPTRVITPSAFAAAWLHWDTLWYLRIAHDGYATPPASAFFPLYPLSIHVLTPLIGGHPLVAALLTSNLAALAAYVGIAAWARLAEQDREGRGQSAVSTQTLRLFAAQPLAVFLVAAYADSLFIALAVWAMVAAMMCRWPLAFTCAALAGLAHITALILILPLAWEYASSFAAMHLPDDGSVRPRAAAASAARTAAVAGAPLVGIVCYAVYCRVHAGDALLFLHAERHDYLRVVMPPWQSLSLAAGDLLAAPMGSFAQVRQLIDLLPLVVVAACLLIMVVMTARDMWHRTAPLRVAPAAVFYLAGLLALAIAAPVVAPRDFLPFAAVGRYLLAAVPACLLLARFVTRLSLRTRRWRGVGNGLVIAGFLLQVMLALFFLLRPDASFGLV